MAKAKKKVAKRKVRKAKKRKSTRKLKALPWRVAYSLDELRAQVNAKAPGRSKISDGTIGDAAHQSRSSDHNAWRRDKKGQPVVGALDVTHDPRNGVDSYAIAQSLAKSGDPRLDYIISNGKIWNKSGGWVRYNGKSPHDHHVHVSVSDYERLFDKKGPWKFDMTFGDPGGQVPGDVPVQTLPTDVPVLARGMMNNEYVKDVQRLLGIGADGDFGPMTERAVRAFQTARGLTVDGKVGPQTWRALRAAKATAPSTAQNVVAIPTSHEMVREYVFDDEGREMTVHSDEPGGASRLGISIPTLSRHLGRQATQQDLIDMSEDTAWEIYDRDFWDRIGADKLPAGLNYAAFDFAVNSGPAVVDNDDTNNPKIVQDFLDRALEEENVHAQIDKLCDLRLEYMKTNPRKWERYQRGWTARVDRVRARAHNMAT